MEEASPRGRASDAGGVRGDSKGDATARSDPSIRKTGQSVRFVETTPLGTPEISRSAKHHPEMRRPPNPEHASAEALTPEPRRTPRVGRRFGVTMPFTIMRTWDPQLFEELRCAAFRGRTCPRSRND